MYNDNNKKLRTVFLVLTIVLVLLRIVKIAKAEEYSDRSSYISEFLDTTAFSSSQKSTILSYVPDYPYFFFAQASTGHSCIYLFKTNTGLLEYAQSNGQVCVQTSTGVRSSSMLPNADTSLIDYYSFSVSPYNESCGNHIVYQSTNYPSGSIVYNYVNVTRVSGFSSNGVYVSPALYRCNIDTNFRVSASYTTFTKNVDEIQYTDDSRLKFWSFDNLDGSKTLVTDLSEFLQGSEGVMDNQISRLVLTYELDNIEHTLTLDSSNSIIRRSGTATSYRVETPFSAFGFDSSVSEFDITKCDFTLTYSAYGYSTTENYKISCDYPAFRQSSPVDPAVIPSPAVSDPTVDSSVYTFINTVYGSYSSDRYGRSGTWDVSLSEPSDVSVFRSVDIYHFANEEHGSGVDESIYYYSLLDWSNTQLDITAYTVFDWDKFLSENTSALYFDVISVPVYHFTPVGQSSTISGRVFDGYALFYTPSYFLRQQYGLLGDILTVVDQDAQNQYNNGIWLVDKINDFEDKTLDVLNASLDIETDSLSWLKTLDNSIKSLDFPDFDDSSILSGIASIVSALSGDNDDLGVNGRLDKLINFFVANDAERNDSALTYRNWLDGLDPTETRRVTHFGTNIYSLVKNIFDIFDADYTEDPSFENPDKDYLGIASDYIDALNNRNNTNKFFRGFFDSSFDPLEQSGLPEE